MVQNVTIPRFIPGPEESLFDGPDNSWTRSNNEIPTIFLKCPEGHHTTIPHRIDASGKVSPSIVCPEPPAEHYHVYGTFEDWNMGERPDTKGGQ